MKKKLVKILGGVIAVALVAAAVIVIDPFGGNNGQQSDNVSAQQDEADKISESAEVEQEDLVLQEDMAQEEVNTVPEQSYDPLSLTISADCIRECDLDNVKETTIDGKYAVLTFDNEEEAKEALEVYQEDDEAQADYLQYMYIMDTGESEYNFHSYGPEDIDSDMIVDDILTKYGSASNVEEVVVAVIDSGVNYNHVWLKGYVDTDNDYDFWNNDDDAIDDNGHGSNVASIIVDAAFSNVKILPYKVTNSSGSGTMTGIYDAIIKAADAGAAVINISMGGADTSKYLDTPINYAVGKGVAVVVAAGNENDDTAGYSPANSTNAITVAALDSTGDPTYFSNYGDEVDLAAPGYGIKGADYDGNTESDEDTTTMNGTSQATPFVSAACALVKTLYPSLDGKGVEQVLKNNAVDKGESGFDVRYGYGKVNLSGLTLPVIETAGGDYDSQVTVTITSPDPEAVIYYTTDGTTPSAVDGKTKGTKYTGPFTITSSATVTAVGRINATTDSGTVSESYYIDGQAIDSEFSINTSGLITKYTGNQSVLVIPSKIGNTTVTGFAAKAFYSNSDISNSPNAANIETIVLSEGITIVEDNAFSGCSSLKYVVYNEDYTGRDKLTISSTGNGYLTNATWIAYPGMVVTQEPDTTTYIKGDSQTLNLTGGELMYIDSNRKVSMVSMDANGVTVSGYNYETAGEQTITVSYGGQSTTFEVEVQDRKAGQVKVSITAVGYTITDPDNTSQSIAQTGKNNYYYDSGTSVTLNYTDDSTVFRLWSNANGQILASSAAYTFTPTEDVKIYAVHTSEIITGDEALVVFKSHYGQIVKAVTYTASELSASDFELPAGPNYMGYTFTGWNKTKATIITEMATSNYIEVEPVYSSDSKTHNIDFYFQGTQEDMMNSVFKITDESSKEIVKMDDSDIVTQDISEDTSRIVKDSESAEENYGSVNESSKGTSESEDAYMNKDEDSIGNNDETVSDEDAAVNDDDMDGEEDATVNDDDMTGCSDFVEAQQTDETGGDGTVSIQEFKSTTYSNKYVNILNSVVQTIEAPELTWYYRSGGTKVYGGYTFQYWLDGDGHILSYNMSFPFCSAKDVKLVASYAQYELEATPTPLINITQINPSTLSGSSTTTYNMSFIENYYLPTGATLVGVGYVETTSAARATESKLVLGGDSVNVLESDALTSLEGIFIQDVTTTNPNKTVYMRGFLQYKLSGETEVSTIYTDIESCSYNSLN